ncbi:MAG: response regulator [bacterium]
MRILIVDDEPSILEILSTLLGADGNHKVVTATSGHEALDVIDRADEDFDCFLLDIQMPGMDGVSLCQAIRLLPDYAQVPIIMLTAMSQRAYVEKAFSVGATDYVTKPFDLLELSSTLRAASKIVYEINIARDAAESARHVLRKLDDETKPPRDEPLSIEGVERVVSYPAFENYVLALSRTRLLFSKAFAVKIVDFHKLHEATNARQMRAILKTVAQVIVDQVPDPGNLVSYRGNGVYLCVNQNRMSLSTSGSTIQIDDAPQVSAAPAQVRELNFVVGPEVSLVSISKTGALMALRKAVDMVERQAVPPRDIAELSKRVLRSQSRSLEQSNLTRRAYEMVLDEILREEHRGTN